jgi:C4-dicarboxylate-specific signal transduction histidine kinase
MSLSRGTFLPIEVLSLTAAPIGADGWQAQPMKVLAAVLAGLALLISFYWLTSTQRARTQALRREIVERERAEALAAAAARDLAHVSRLATAGELATSIAHELNQPLAAVVGYAQTARRLVSGGDDADLKELLEAIVIQSHRAADVIRSLRAFVVKQRYAEGIVSVNQVVAGPLRLLRPELTARGITVTVIDEQRVPGRTEGDEVQLQQVLVNLVLNAADAIGSSPATRQVTVSLGENDEYWVRISVADQGPGLSPEMLAHVFEPFFTTKQGGLGLGLSLSRSIVEAHGGNLVAESLEGQGATFHVRLPRYQG